MLIRCVNMLDCCHVAFNFAKAIFGWMFQSIMRWDQVYIYNMSSTWFDTYYSHHLIMAEHPSTSLVRYQTLPSIGPCKMKAFNCKVECKLDILCPSIVNQMSIMKCNQFKNLCHSSLNYINIIWMYDESQKELIQKPLSLQFALYKTLACIHNLEKQAHPCPPIKIY